MFGVLACPVRTDVIFVPDPWEEFIEDVVWPFVRHNADAGVLFIGFVAVALLFVGLFGNLSTRERRMCGALPMIVGIAMFIGVLRGCRDARWWEFHSEFQTTVLAAAFVLGVLGLLVVERRAFIEDD